MDEKELELLYDLIQDAGTQEGIIPSVESLKGIIENEGIEVLFPLFPSGSLGSPEELGAMFPSLKKKIHPPYQVRSRIPKRDYKVEAWTLPC